MDLSKIPYIPARYQSEGRPRKPYQIVIHSTEGGTSGEATARWFASPIAPRSSAHYSVGDDGAWCSVRPENQAWATGHSATNQISISIEQVGFARWTREQWLAHQPMLGTTRELVAALGAQYGIPIRRLTVDEVKAGQSGICSHFDITQAFKIFGGHTDPGDGYPWDMILVKSEERDDMVALARNADGRLEEFRATGTEVIHRWQAPTPSGWTDWVSMGEVPATSIAAATNADGRLEVIVVAGSKSWRAWQTAPNSGWSDWVEA